MSNESITHPRRSRGRPKKSVNYATLAGFTNLNRPSAFTSKRKQTEEESDEIQILSTNGLETTQIKKSKIVVDQPRRFSGDQPRRFSGDQPKRFSSDQPKRFSGDQPKRFSGDQPKQFSGDQPKRFSSDQPKRFSDDQPKRFSDDQPRRFSDDQPKRFLDDQPKHFPDDQTRRSLDDQPKRSQPHRAARFTESYGGSPDVVIVSDEENQEESESDSDSSEYSPIPSPVYNVKTKEELELYESNIQILKKQLNDEEMKLVLLLKLKDSQKVKEPKTEASGSPLPSATLPSNLPNITTQKIFPVISRNNVQQPLPNKQLLPNKFLPIKKEMKPNPITITNNGPQRHSSPAPVALVKSDSSSISIPATQSSQLKSNTLNQYPLLKNLSNQITVTPVPPTPSPVVSKPEEKIDPEVIYQRQAAAKLALRKQLEKQLLQIPLPKAPPMKLNFFPNANSIEFLCLLGLDCVVDFLTKAKKVPPRDKPLCCAQCSTDFTCSWKWKETEKNGEKVFSVFCEACINSNIRKALKAQHTNSLKSAFLKALQQEKEIDRLSQTIPKSHSSTREPRQNSCLPVPAPPAHQAHNSSAYSLPKTGTTLTYIPKPSSALNHTNLGQVGKLNPQFQSLLQAQAQHLLASGVPLHPNVLSLTSFVPPSTHHNQGKSSTGQHDFRRQYRQDRTQSPSVPPASTSWKA